MKSKKILFVIVEGPSDEEALGVLFNRIFDRNVVYVHVVHADITTKTGITPANIVSKVGDIVRQFAGKTFKKSDFYGIIHLTDTDGAFISNDYVIDDPTQLKPLYSTTAIRTHNKPGIEDRNKRKSENLRRLFTTQKIWGIPYSIYYMSCNLDHVLYNKLNISALEKEQDAFAFAKKYRNNVPAFLEYITNSDFSVMTNYIESWKYITEDNNSLCRHTNLCLCFKDIELSQSTG